MVQLSDELVGLLDEEAARRQVSRSALIRDVLAEHLANSAEALVTKQIIEGYQRIPPTTPDQWGDLGQASERSWLELAQRLDAEEAAAGLEPW